MTWKCYLPTITSRMHGSSSRNCLKLGDCKTFSFNCFRSSEAREHNPPYVATLLDDITSLNSRLHLHHWYNTSLAPPSDQLLVVCNTCSRKIRILVTGISVLHYYNYD